MCVCWLVSGAEQVVDTCFFLEGFVLQLYAVSNNNNNNNNNNNADKKH